MKVTITQAVIDKAQPKSKPFKIRDKKLIGILVRVQPTGKMTYYREYRRGGRVNIGPESACSVKFARTQAKQILADFYQGGEPAITAKKAKEIVTYRDFLEEHYFQWVEANQKGPQCPAALPGSTRRFRPRLLRQDYWAVITSPSAPALCLRLHLRQRPRWHQRTSAHCRE